MTRRSHAVHNEKACDYLLKSRQFNDWVVTTAFYSALHYVRSVLFPLTINGTTYNNLDNYFYVLRNKPHNNLSKHQIIIQLVNSNLKSVASHYRWLHDSCMTTRYNDYQVSDKKAKTARKRLSQIKNHLNLND